MKNNNLNYIGASILMIGAFIFSWYHFGLLPIDGNSQLGGASSATLSLPTYSNATTSKESTNQKVGTEVLPPEEKPIEVVKVELPKITLSGEDLWSSIIAPNRAIDWAKAGLPPTYPDGETTANPWTPPVRTNICATINPMGSPSNYVNADAIVNALNNCSPGGVVLLAPGNFYLTSLPIQSHLDGSYPNTVNGVTVRGAGADKTFVYISGGAAYVGGGTYAPAVPVTGGLSQGSTQITLQWMPVQVGSLIALTQCSPGFSVRVGESICSNTTDSQVDNGGLWICSGDGPWCSHSPLNGGGGDNGGGGPFQTQIVKVTGINGNTVTISPGIYLPNWDTSNTVIATYFDKPVYGVGLEGITLDTTQSGASNNLAFCNGCWIKGVRFVNGNIFLRGSENYLLSNNYLSDYAGYGYRSGYGITLGDYGFGDGLVLNNIIGYPQSLATNGGGEGTVFAYNYIDGYGIFFHTGGTALNLMEGNEAPFFQDDNIHGVHDLDTLFRNRFTGKSGSFGFGGPINAVNIGQGTRFVNIIGNVLGTAELQQSYEKSPTTPGPAFPSVYDIGTGAEDPNGQGIPYDKIALDTLFKWGNVTAYAGSVHGPSWSSSEVPSSLNAAIGYQQQIGTGNGSQTTFTGTLSHLPLIAPNTMVYDRRDNHTAYDDGSGVGGVGNLRRTANSANITGNINYTTGAVTATFATAPTNGSPVYVNYLQQTANASPFRNPIPSSQYLPPSLIFPNLVRGSSGTNLPFGKVCTNYSTSNGCGGIYYNFPIPGIGPDVTGGDGPGGYSYKIPASVAFANLPIDPAYSNNQTRVFNESIYLKDSSQTQTYNITATAGSNGTISPSGTVPVNSGGSQIFAISANNGYQPTVLVDGSTVTLTNNQYTFTNVTADHTISVTFTAGGIVRNVTNTSGQPSCERVDVQRFVDLSSDGDTVIIPAGTCTWTNTLTINKAITLQGAGVGSTIIRDNVQTPNQLILWSLPAGRLSRLTGIEFRDGGRTAFAAAPNGIIKIEGLNTNGSQFRMDHCKWDNLNGHFVTETVIGVIDHTTILLGLFSREWLYNYGSHWNGGDYGDGSWADTAHYGTDRFLFVEDCTIVGSNDLPLIQWFDGFGGSRAVIRHNMMFKTLVGAHGTESTGRVRGNRVLEVYENTIDDTRDGGNWPDSTFVQGLRSGSLLFHNNTLLGVNAGGPINGGAAYRMTTSNDHFPPWYGADGTNGWDQNTGPFYTGIVQNTTGLTVTVSPSLGSANYSGYTVKRTLGGNIGGFAYISGNTSNTLNLLTDFTGNPNATFTVGEEIKIYRVTQSIDQPGVGQSTLISGPATTPPQGWNQAVEPIYVWGNTSNNGNPNVWSPLYSNTREGTHYFNNTCPPTGSYTPYTYPHPLTGLQPQTQNLNCPGTPAPITLSVVKVGTGSGTVTSNIGGINCGSVCTSSVLNSGTQVTLTPTIIGNSTFGGWSGCDSISGSNCIVTMTSARTVTATFTTQGSQQLPPPTITSPQNGSTLSGTSATFSWNAVPGANSYLVRLSNLTHSSQNTHPTCPNTMVCTDNYQNTSFNFTGLLPGDTYDAWVHAAPLNLIWNPPNYSDASHVTFTMASTNPLPTVTLSASPTSITQGHSSNLSWTSTNATSCVGTGGSFAGSRPTSGTNFQVTPQNTTTYSITCSGPGGTSNPSTATVTVTTQSPPSSLLTVNVVGNGRVNSNPTGITNCATTCSHTFDNGHVFLTPTESSGYRFSGWDLPSCETLVICDIDLNTNTTIRATFTLLPPSDSDQDGVPDTSDLCPSTPIGSVLINPVGCPRPKMSNFDIKPNVEGNLNSVSNVEIGKAGTGKVKFTPAVSLIKASNGGTLDINSNLRFSKGKITLDSVNMPELNKPATVTFYNLNLHPNSQYLRPGGICSGCQLVSYINKTLIFTVPGFSTYEVLEDESGGLGGGDDITAPVISSVRATSITKNKATIKWTTDESSDSQVEYGLTTSYGNTTSLSDTTNGVTSHTVNLSSLTGNTTYHYRVKSKDTSGNLTTSGDNTFKTKSSGGGGGGGGGNNNPPPSPTSVPGCNPGDIFSSTTGQRCPTQTQTISGCSVGVIFSPITGQRCPTTITTTPPTYIPPSTPPTSSIYTRNLTGGSQGVDVTTLQRYLISKGYLGAGRDNGFFGYQTIYAVQALQRAAGIVPASGFFGVVTRNWVISH